MIGDVGQRKQAFAYLAALVVAVAIIPPIANANPPSDLPESTQGTAAVAKFADRLDELATRYGLEKASFQALLQTDPDIWVDEDGALFYMDPPQAAGGVPPPLALAPFPYADTFKLHSLPGSNRTIYLDFDGETISGTAWNGGGSDINATPFDTDGNGASFTNSEQDYIQSVWQRVAEDFAPFDVDVTTEDPGFAAIDRNSYGDTVYGTRILITNIASSSICGGACGGVAYVGVFDKLPFGYPHSYYQPAWVFPNSLGSAKAVAEATSHEAGHNLSLYHDGTSAVSYYTGQGSWAPIMGVGYYRPIVQWSQGEYADANNSEDDIAKIVAGGAPLRTDDHGDTSGASTSLSGPSFAASGIISTRADVDVFGFSTTGGLVTITVDPAPTSPNLDISIELRDSGGTLLASDDPAVATISSDSASGLSATLSKTVPSGSYYIHVDGVGFGDPTGTGYSDYGSLGSYTLTGNVGTPVCNTLTSSTAGSGSFTRNPTNSSGCSSGEYYAGEDISLDATPVATWQLNLWSSVGEGSFADSGAEDTVFTMPASAVTVLATFGLIPIPLDCSAGACSFSFDAADDWTFSGLWHIETNATITGMNGGTLAFNTSCTGPGVTDCTYADGSSQTTGVATSPPLDVGSGKLLTFTTAREVEAQSPVCPSPQDWDQTYVEYSTNSGSTWSALTLTSISSSGQDIVANEICGEGLTAQTVTASVPVNTTHIRFIFDSVDHILNIFPGQFIDDVNLDDPGPTKLTFTQEPSGGAPGVAFPSQPVVAVQTDADTTDSGDNSTTVTLSLIGSGTLTCNGGLSKTVTSGVATFDGCSIDTVGSVQVHAVSSPTLTPADTASFTVTDSTRKLASPALSPSSPSMSITSPM